MKQCIFLDSQYYKEAGIFGSTKVYNWPRTGLMCSSRLDLTLFAESNLDVKSYNFLHIHITHIIFTILYTLQDLRLSISGYIQNDWISKGGCSSKSD